MTPGVTNFVVTAGDTFVQPLTFRTGSTTGTLFDFTGASARFVVYDDGGSETIRLTLTSGSGITLGGALGTITVTLTASQTGTLGVGSFRFGLQVTSAANVTTTYLTGRIKILKRTAP